jgi:hypothetical protein
LNQLQKSNMYTLHLPKNFDPCYCDVKIYFIHHCQMCYFGMMILIIGNKHKKTNKQSIFFKHFILCDCYIFFVNGNTLVHCVFLKKYFRIAEKNVSFTFFTALKKLCKQNQLRKMRCDENCIMHASERFSC